MKHATTIIFAIACLVLAFALFRTRPTPPSDGTIYVSDSAFIPANADEDLALLDRQVHAIRFDSVPLGEAIKTLSKAANVQISVDWTTLKKYDIGEKSPVHAIIENGSLGDAISLVLHDFDSHETRIAGYYIAGGIVTITGEEEAERHPVRVLLNIRPLLEEVVSYSDEGRLQIERSAATGRHNRLPTREERVEEITSLIQRSVASDTWHDFGGVAGEISETGGVLVIEQTPQNIRATRQLLDQLHQAFHTVHFPPVTQSASATTLPPLIGPLQTNIAADGTALTVAYFNIRSLVAQIVAFMPQPPPGNRNPSLSNDDAVNEITKFLTDAVEPDSWQENGGNYASIDEVGGVLLIIQTPANIDAVRIALQNLNAAIQRHEFPPPVPVTPHKTPPAN